MCLGSSLSAGTKHPVFSFGVKLVIAAGFESPRGNELLKWKMLLEISGSVWLG